MRLTSTLIASVRRSPALSLGLFAAACGGPAGPAASEIVDSTAAALAGEETQGRELVGDRHGGVWKVWLQDGLRIEKGALVGAAGDPKLLVGTKLRAQVIGSLAPLTVRIDKIEAASADTSADEYLRSMDPTGGSWLYTVSADSGKGFVPLCTKDKYGSTKAIPIDEFWDAEGDMHVDGKRAFTFACLSGVIAKCYKWSYLPWAEPDPSAPAQMRNVHWACTRAGRADYCGDGKSHTYDDTAIDIWDNATLQPVRKEDAELPTDGTPPLMFEAGWGTLGALCLTHLRWANFPNNLCAGVNSSLYGWSGERRKIGHICDSQIEAEKLAEHLIAGGDPLAQPVRIFIASHYNTVP